MYSQIIRYFIISVLALLHGTGAFLAESEEDLALENRIMENHGVLQLWINDKRDPKQQYLIPGVKNAEELRNEFANHTIGWSNHYSRKDVKNIFFGYDSEMTTQKAIEATKRDLADYPIIFIDGRTIPTVSAPENRWVFSDKTDVHFRADLFKVLFALHITEHYQMVCVIFPDLDIKPIPKKITISQK